MSITSWQRLENLQPWGRDKRLGTVPDISFNDFTLFPILGMQVNKPLV
jgi:hypothetical protein